MITGLTLYLAGVLVTAVSGFIWGTASRTSERLAAPRREKLEAERTAFDRAIIEADKKIDAFQIDQFDGFLTSWVASRFDDILKTAPVIGPMATAADHAADALADLAASNPDLVRALNPTIAIIQRKLAGVIGLQTKDLLADALVRAGVKGVATVR